MDIRESSSQFIVYIFDSDPDVGSQIKVQVAQAGYDTYYFSDWEQLFTSISSQPPHILFFSVSQMSGSLSEFIEKVLNLSGETKFLVSADEDSFEALQNYSSYGLEWVLGGDRKSLGSKVLWAVDRVCEKLYLTYQNESLLRDLQQAAKENAEKPVVIKEADWTPILQAYRSSASKEETLQIFFNRLDSLPVLYFKFIPSTLSLIALNASGVDTGKIQGQGCRLEGRSLQDLSKQLSLGVVPPVLNEMLLQTFQLSEPRLLPLYTLGQLEGVITYSAKLSEAQKQTLANEFGLMSLCYSYLTLEKRLDLLEMQDPVTELFNLKIYQDKLQDEVLRSKRGLQAVSLLKIAIDDFYEIEQAMGESSRDLVLKNITSILKTSTRANDILCRTAMNEISMILPFCHRKGAMIRAERIRRSIESSQSLLAGTKISVSIGISEFPSLCGNAETLNETALKALNYILDKGGNKICLYKAPASHKPEFVVSVEQA